MCGIHTEKSCFLKRGWQIFFYTGNIMRCNLPWYKFPSVERDAISLAWGSLGNLQRKKMWSSVQLFGGGDLCIMGTQWRASASPSNIIDNTTPRSWWDYVERHEFLGRLEWIPGGWAWQECIWSHTEKTIFPFPFTSNGMWSWWQFSFRFWTKWNSIWFRIVKKTVATIIFHSISKDTEIHFRECRLSIVFS